MPKLIAITGGIGCGKSVISKLLTIINYKVYDCDYNAKRLIRNSSELRHLIINCFGSDSYDINGDYNTSYISSIVFSSPERLIELNNIVHPFVKNDIIDWMHNNRQEKLLFIETAILEESNLSDIVDYIIYVTAPLELRISRVMNRNGVDRESVIKRINSQQSDCDYYDIIIDNGYDNSLIKQIHNALYLLTNKN